MIAVSSPDCHRKATSCLCCASASPFNRAGRFLAPSEVHHYTAHARPHSSGAWVLVATHRAHTFEDVFGAAPALAASA
ncbi:hypothetical protein GCM10010129_44320 [Streptomyces fumigatiscleroticus]|nr:hypothetical protein GCM10010129_44320 [Streptomyces fumigatiscleroticus]